MEITAIDAWPVWNGRSNGLFVTVDRDEGRSGVGEAGISKREHAIICAIEQFRPVLQGMDPFRREYIWQMQAVCEAVGDEIEIAFDAHTRLDLPDALWLYRQMEPYRPFFVEDSLRSENTHSCRALRSRTAVPLDAGEQFSSKWEFRQLIEEDLIDFARIDLCIVGGLTEARKIAVWCETHYVKPATHNPLGPVSSAACLHLNLASPLVGVQEQARMPGSQMQGIFPGQIVWKDGWLLPPERPGPGVTFDRDAARAHPMRERLPSNLQRADGSFTNT